MIERRIGEYKNHYLLKKNRLKKLEIEEAKCEECGLEANIVHHLDGGRENHEISNLKVLCTTHHGLVHRFPNRNKGNSLSLPRYIKRLKNMNKFINKRYRQVKTEKEYVLDCLYSQIYYLMSEIIEREEAKLKSMKDGRRKI